MNENFTKVFRPEPIEDSLLRIIKRYERDSYYVDLYSDNERCVFDCMAKDLKTVLSGNYVIGWENDNANTCWVLCEIKMPEECNEYKGREVIDVLVTIDKNTVTKVQRIKMKNYNGEPENHWYWGRVRGNIRAWMPLPRGYKLRGV